MASQLKAIIYSRVSTDAQERDGTSLDSQENACVEHAHANGWHVLDRVRDTASGYSLERPGMERVRQLLRQGTADVVVAYAVDRLSRNQNQIGVLFDDVEQAGARLEFVTENFEDSAIGRFILTARAFVAEVEREKIAERTMRGKAERAKSGRIPQGTGKGCYGYVYEPETGKRRVDAFQATVVRRLFQRYTETRSFSSVSAELNDAGIPSHSGGRWYPLTIRRTLTNESYTGRFIYRKTKRVKIRNSKQTRVVEQPPENRILVEDACPRIIDEQLWDRVQGIINDPERIRRRPTARFYLLKGRAKCGICGSAMVGQTLTVKMTPFTYYRCRHVYDRNTGRNCTARYVRGDKLEDVVWREIKRVLANPTVVLEELEREASASVDTGEIDSLEEELKSLTGREKRLIRLFAMGNVDEASINEELDTVSRQKALISQQLATMQPSAPPSLGRIDEKALERMCNGVARWLDNADDSQRTIALEAMQIEVTATKETADIQGVLPAPDPEFIADEHTSRCSFSGE